jgi:uncharacterized protein YybS (DUF2232 family)
MDNIGIRSEIWLFRVIILLELLIAFVLIPIGFIIHFVMWFLAIPYLLITDKNIFKELVKSMNGEENVVSTGKM